MSAESVELRDVLGAADRLRGTVSATPLLPLRLASPGNTDCWIKAESIQLTGAFKFRGAFSAAAAMPDAVRARGVVATSSGNHALGVALAGRLLHFPVTIVMPSTAPATKRASLDRFGVEVILVGQSSDEWISVASDVVRSRGMTWVSSYDSAPVIAGQGTIGLEIVDQLASRVGPTDPVCVLVPIGGGGLAAGVAVAIKSLRPATFVVGVEPAEVAKTEATLRTGSIVRLPADSLARTIADALRVVALGELPFRVLQGKLDAVVTVSDREIEHAVVEAATSTHLVLEPAGAAALAAWLFHRDELPEHMSTVCVATGGNVDPRAFADLLRRSREDVRELGPDEGRPSASSQCSSRVATARCDPPAVNLRAG